MAKKKQCPLKLNDKVPCKGKDCKWFEKKKCTVPECLSDALAKAYERHAAEKAFIEIGWEDLDGSTIN